MPGILAATMEGICRVSNHISPKFLTISRELIQVKPTWKMKVGVGHLCPPRGKDVLTVVAIDGFTISALLLSLVF
ncbi:hypothetical protein DAI22_01g165050 [Oryza sativa Japonica Group]|nr:hypothetical protein DAI22_01g165050 [Oryza sativa Japonica Group]